MIGKKMSRVVKTVKIPDRRREGEKGAEKNILRSSD